MSRSSEERIDDILKCREKIFRYISGMRSEDLIENDLVMDAVLRNIQVIGEASKKLPVEMRAQLSEIEWNKITGMRDWVSHVYFGIDDQIVWNTVETKIPQLLRVLHLHVKENPPNAGDVFD